MRCVGIRLPDFSNLLYLLLPAAELPTRLISKSPPEFDITPFSNGNYRHSALSFKSYPTNMNSLSVTELHTLRLAIFDNAENLHKEALLLHEHKMFSRAYLLAHFCFEELGKIPIIVGAIGKLKSGEPVDWRRLKNRFYSHTEKIASQNRHYYTFGLDTDLLQNTDLRWLESAQQKVNKSFEMKNLATYVDASEGKILRPIEQISEIASKELLDLAFECLRAHWHSENLANPALKELVNKYINRTS